MIKSGPYGWLGSSSIPPVWRLLRGHRAMNQPVRNASAAVRIGASACPHDCPSTCALDVEIVDGSTIGRVRGAADNDYTSGVICAKVARYAERVHHKDRLLTPLRRKARKGTAAFARTPGANALDITPGAPLRAEQRHGPQPVGPYYYAGP